LPPLAKCSGSQVLPSSVAPDQNQPAALAYAAERYQGGKQIIDHSHLRTILGAMSAQTITIDGAVQAAAARPKDVRLALGTKIIATGAALGVCTDAVQLLGGYGYMREYGLEKAMRDAAVLGLLPLSNARAELLVAAHDKAAL